MNWRVLRIVCAVIFTSALLTPSFCQNYYIVVGAFATENDQIREFTSYLPGNFSDTAYTVLDNKNQFHLYILKTSDKDLALAKALKLQKEIETNDPELANVLTIPKEAAASASAVMKTADSKIAPADLSRSKVRSKNFKFTILKPDGTPVPGNIHQLDPRRGQAIGTFATGEYITIPQPGKNQTLTTVCGIFGYKEISKEISYADPSITEGAYVDGEGIWVIPYKLSRLEKGDVSVMNNVAFYKDASIMLPSSRQDLNELIAMMQSNPNYIIKIHAHCNGKGPRKVILPGAPKNYFEVSSSMQTQASAKQLTKYRAGNLKAYLVQHGIDEKRIKVFGWGGNDMLVPETNKHAKVNDRIEIEILKD